ncbi:MAG TPA: FxsA family protein, partial [Lacipirellulaceae bacterium]|nr:FxsA family protein [Lacipirellulaceae bacterium]
GVGGASLARWQGWRVLERIRQDLRAGRMPAEAVIDGFMVLLAGVLLVIPGVLTDVVGIALLIPPIRSLIKRGAKAWIKKNIEVHVGRVNQSVWASAGNTSSREHDHIVDAKVLETHIENDRS